MFTLGCPLDLLPHDLSWGDIKNSLVTPERCTDRPKKGICCGALRQLYYREIFGQLIENRTTRESHRQHG